MNTKILGIDIGYGDTKIVYGTSGGTIIKKFKFSSTVALTQHDELAKDDRIYKFNDKHFYVGDQALKSRSQDIIDIRDYEHLETFAPLFLAHAIKEIGEIPDVIVTGLSKAQTKYSGYFKKRLQSFNVNDINFEFENVFVLPQGAGSKICIDKYGDSFPQVQKQFTGDTTYIGCDIGFNTLDIFVVVDGILTPNLFEGIEKEGIMKIATIVALKVQQVHGRSISLHEAKEILNTGIYKLRGESYDFSTYVRDAKLQYLDDLKLLLQAKYHDFLDKCDFVHLSGGGSAIFSDLIGQTPYYHIPSNSNEYYNAIGFYLFYDKSIKK